MRKIARTDDNNDDPRIINKSFSIDNLEKCGEYLRTYLAKR